MAIMDAGGHPLYDGGKPPSSPEAVRAYGYYVGNFTQHYAAEVASAQIVVEITFVHHSYTTTCHLAVPCAATLLTQTCHPAVCTVQPLC
eukprot:SAG22_NODE_1230_length_5074_cov_3.372864_5_plen_89_part_00